MFDQTTHEKSVLLAEFNPRGMSATTKKPNACGEKHDKVKQKHCGAVF